MASNEQKLQEFDFFWEEPGAIDYVKAAKASADRGRDGVHEHDALEIAVRHSIPSDMSKLMCFMASNRVKEDARRAAYFPYEPLPEGYADEL